MTAYEMTVGLEVHIELAAKTKMFCACPVTFGKEPNTVCCPVCMGFPGALPVLNRQAVRYAALAGLAMHCEIAPRSVLSRKQYFYPDLPKAYQITQDAEPLCRRGYLDVEADGETARIRIGRIHIEEDAGKLIHRDGVTLVDCNRCGVPLIEIVSMPDIRSAAQAAAYLRAVAQIARELGISDCRMEEGSMRCDVNLSVKPVGTQTVGVRTEIKNVNSFSYVQKAIAAEFERQTDRLAHGLPILSETLRYDEKTGKTYPMRRKESAADYRYFDDPDLPPVLLPQEEIDALRRTLPEFSRDCARRLAASYGIPQSEAAAIAADRSLACDFETAAHLTAYPAVLAHITVEWLLPAVASGTICAKSEGEESALSPSVMAELAQLLGEGVVNSSAAKKIFSHLTTHGGTPRALADALNLRQIRTPEALLPIVRQAVAAEERAVRDYRGGKRAALRSVVGAVMRLSGGRADPVLAQTLIERVIAE